MQSFHAQLIIFVTLERFLIIRSIFFLFLVLLPILGQSVFLSPSFAFGFVGSLMILVGNLAHFLSNDRKLIGHVC